MDNRILNIIITSFPKILLPGLLRTIPLTVLAFIIALIIGVVVALIRFAKIKVLNEICRFYVWFIRGTPLLVQLYVVFYGFPKLGIIWDPFVCAVVVFALNEGAYCSETIRGSLESVSYGQIEAGYCVGMKYIDIMLKIVLPQALKSSLPSLMNNLIGMVKDTSLAANITVAEMFMATQKLVATTYEPLVLYIELAFVYLLFSSILSWLQRRLEVSINKRLG